MIRYSFIAIAVLLVADFQTVIGATDKCVECASPILRSQWQVTSYPQILADTKFDARCANLMNLAPGFTVDCASSLCVEMIIPTDSGYAFLRGCLEKLLGNYRSNATLQNSNDSNTGDCSYGPAGRKVNIPSGTASVSDDGYIGIHFCKTRNDKNDNLYSSFCNSQMKSDKLDEVYNSNNGGGMISYFQDINCPRASDNAATCINCLSVDDNGACDKKNTGTCSGAYCTKVFGKQGLTEFVKRGCSPINPYGLKTDGCTQVSFQSNTILSDGTMGGASRAKRDTDLSLTYEADQCFCTGDKCNGATSLTFAFFTVLTPIFIAVRVL